MQHPDETAGEYNYCPECGWNAIIYTWPHKFGQKWRCDHCGDCGTIHSPEILKLIINSSFYFEHLPEKRDPETGLIICSSPT